MAHKSVIVLQKPNERINPTFLSILCKDYPSYMGVVAIQAGKLVLSGMKGSPKVEAFEDVSKAFGAGWMGFTLGKIGSDFLDEDIQPFDLLKDKDGQTIVAGLFDGNFEGYSVVKSTHVDEWHMVNDVIIPKLKKLYKMCDNDVTQLIEELKDPVTQRDFVNYSTGRGNVVLFTASADPIVVSTQNVFQSPLNWGWTSNAGNYKEQTVAKAEPVAAKTLSILEKMKAKANGKIEVIPPDPDAAVAVTGPAAKTSSSASAMTVMDEYEDYQLPPEAKDMTNKQKIELWVKEIGYKPEGYKELRTVVKRRKGTKMGLLHPLMAQKAKEEAVANGAASPLPKKEFTAGLPEPVVEPSTEHVKDTSVKNVTTAYMPILSPKQKINLKTSWLKDAEVVKVLGDDYRSTIDPKLLTEMTDTYATLWDGLGMDSMWLSYEAIVKLGEADLRSLAIYAFNKQNEAKQAEIKLKAIVADPGKRIAM